MTGVGKKSSCDIQGEIKYDWTSETQVTEGICGFQNNSLYCYMNSCMQCLLAIDNLRDYYAQNIYEQYSNIQTVADKQEYS